MLVKLIISLSISRGSTQFCWKWVQIEPMRVSMHEPCVKISGSWLLGAHNYAPGACYFVGTGLPMLRNTFCMSINFIELIFVSEKNTVAVVIFKRISCIFFSITRRPTLRHYCTHLKTCIWLSFIYSYLSSYHKSSKFLSPQTQRPELKDGV